MQKNMTICNYNPLLMAESEKFFIGTVRSSWTWLCGRYHVPQNAFLVCVKVVNSLFRQEHLASEDLRQGKSGADPDSGTIDASKSFSGNCLVQRCIRVKILMKILSVFSSNMSQIVEKCLISQRGRIIL